MLVKKVRKSGGGEGGYYYPGKTGIFAELAYRWAYNRGGGEGGV